MIFVLNFYIWAMMIGFGTVMIKVRKMDLHKLVLVFFIVITVCKMMSLRYVILIQFREISMLMIQSLILKIAKAKLGKQVIWI